MKGTTQHTNGMASARFWILTSDSFEEFTSDALVAYYVYGHDLISQERGEETSFYQVDGLGSTRVLTDELGVVTDSYDYDAFGNLISSEGETENSYRYAGEQFDESQNSYYLRQRFYDPNVGRFARKDTYEGIVAEPISLHKYVYGSNSPTNFIDPTGLYSQQDGYNVEAAIEIAYRAERPVESLSTTFGRVARVNGTGATLGIKPDILNHHGRLTGGVGLYNEIKPLSLSGLGKATPQMLTYFLTLQPLGYLPDVDWHKPTSPLILPSVSIGGKSKPVLVFNVGGVLFYTDDTRRKTKQKVRQMVYSNMEEALSATRKLLIETGGTFNELGRSKELINGVAGGLYATSAALIAHQVISKLAIGKGFI